MSTAASPAPSEGESKRGEVAYRFCQDWLVRPSHLDLSNSLTRFCSSNLLYPKEDRSTSQLLFVCKACHATQMFDNACTYRNQLGSTVTETAGVTTDVANDPTVRDDSLMLPCFCTMCGGQIRCGGCGESALEESDMSDIPSQAGDGRDQS
jgi:DNA-directed RNA polymerase subunit M/transcription elongation factor TFIIS